MVAHQLFYLDLDDTGVSACITGNGSRAGAGPDWVRLPWPDPEDRPASLAQVLEALAGELTFSGCRKAVVLVPDQWVCFRTLAFPFSSRGRIRQILEHELAPVLPRDDIPYTTEFQIPGPCGTPGQHLVFTASMPSELISSIRTSLKTAALSPAAIVPRTHALCLGILDPDEALGSSVVVADRWASLVVASRGIPVAARTFLFTRFNPEDLACRIRAALAGICLGTGVGAPGRIHLFSPVPGNRMSELKTALEAGKDPQLREGISLVSAPPALPDPSALSRGLVNLGCGETGAAALFRFHRWGILTALGLCTAVFLLFLAGVWMEIFDLEARSQEVRQASRKVFLDVFPDKAGIMGPYPLTVMQSLVAAGGQKLPRAALEGLEGPGVAGVLAELSGRMPADRRTVVTRLNMDSRRLSLSGTTAAFNQVDRIKTGLSASPLFKSVTIANAQADKSGKAIRFKLAIGL